MSQEYESYNDIINNLRNGKKNSDTPSKSTPKLNAELVEDLDEGQYTLDELESNLFSSDEVLDSCLSGIEAFTTQEGSIEDVVIAPDVESGLTIIGLSDGLATDKGVQMPYATKPSLKKLYRLVYPLFFVDEVLTNNDMWVSLLKELIQGGKLKPISEMDAELYQSIAPTDESVLMATLYTTDLKLLDKKVLESQIDKLLESYHSSNKEQTNEELKIKTSYLDSVNDDYVFYLPLTGQIVGSALS